MNLNETHKDIHKTSPTLKKIYEQADKSRLQALAELYSQLPAGHKQTFCAMYKSLELVTDEQVDWAICQCESSLRKIKENQMTPTEYQPPLHSVNDYDSDGDLVQSGIYLHFGQTRVLVAGGIEGYDAIIKSLIDGRAELVEEVHRTRNRTT